MATDGPMVAAQTSDYPRIDKPLRPGWYWYREHAAGHYWVPRLVQFAKTRGKTSGQLCARHPLGGGLLRIDSHLGQWRGPIPEPTP